MSHAPGEPDPDTLDMLRLTLVPGLGPVRIARLLESFGSPARILAASPAALERVHGIGPVVAANAAKAFAEGDAPARRELAALHAAGARVVRRGTDEFPPLLRDLPSTPPMLFVRGDFRPLADDRFTVAIVGSRECSAYGIEQARRFAGALASTGLTIVSGGARGIDAAAHHAALAAGGRTLAVLGCGLGVTYPPEHADLFAQITRRGAVISELPANTQPTADNFPARNRLISGLSLGVLVIEAGLKSGALITAAFAAEDHGREVFALPGRVDSPSSAGVLDLIKRGGATMVTEPGDVLAALESAARHLHAGTHSARFAPRGLFDQPEATTPPPPIAPPVETGLTGTILNALASPATFDELLAATGLEASRLRAELTLLELAGRLRRQGGRFERRLV